MDRRLRMVWALLLMFSFAGCAQLQSASTSFKYGFPDGRTLEYSSNKEQSGVDVQVDEVDPATGKVIKKWKIKVEKAGTPEAAYAAMIQQQQSVAEQIRAISQLITGIAAKAPVP